MNHQLIGRKLFVAEGTKELDSRVLCDLLAKNIVTEICLPDSLEVIPDNAFFDDPFLAQINLPPHVRHIGTCAFWGLDDLRQEIVLPVTVQSIGKHAFCNCKQLKLTVVADPENLPAGWNPEFAANLGEVRFIKP